MNNKYPNLFSSIKIKPLIFKNRIAPSPTSFTELSSEGHLTKDNKDAHTVVVEEMSKDLMKEIEDAWLT